VTVDDNAPDEEAPPPLWARLLILLVTVVVGIGMCEGIVRWKSGNAVPHVQIFELREGALRLQPNASLKLMRPDHERWTLTTDDQGFRSSDASTGWLVVGDSQVLGMGVPDEAAFPALLGAHNSGVPGFSLDDALQLADQHADTVEGVVVVVNQANDWEEVGLPALDRYAVCGGRLVLLDSPAWRCGWLGSAPTRLQLVYFASLALLPRPAPTAWIAPQPKDTAELRAAVRVFREAHPDLPVLSVFLPVDYTTSAQRGTDSPFAGHFKGRPWEEPSLNEELAMDVDLRPFLLEPGNFQTGDYHLSELGHERVAEALRDALDARFP
jgi:hypothetical protein